MSFALLFWILMLLWFVLWLVSAWGPGFKYSGQVNNVVLFLLLLLLGWQVFGKPVHQ